MTILLCVRGENDVYRREFVDVPHRPVVGESIRSRGTVAKIVDVITQTTEPDVDRAAYDLPPIVDFEAEVLAEPIRTPQTKGVTLWVS